MECILKCYPTLLYGPILLVILKNLPPYSVIYHSSVIWNSRVTDHAGSTSTFNELSCQTIHRCNNRIDPLSGHIDVIKWVQFPRYWPFMQGIHRSPVNSPHKEEVEKI